MKHLKTYEGINKYLKRDDKFYVDLLGGFFNVFFCKYDFFNNISGYKISAREIKGKFYVTEPNEFRSTNADLCDVDFVTAEELFNLYPDKIFNIYEKVSEMYIDHPGIVRYSTLKKALEKSDSLLSAIEGKKYNL